MMSQRPRRSVVGDDELRNFAACLPRDGSEVCRQWTVTAVRVDSDAAGPAQAGAVVAADLEMAAEQVCDRLPATDRDASWYLVATLGTVEIDESAGNLATRTRCQWVSRIHREEANWQSGAWIPAEGDLRTLDANAWCSATKGCPMRS
ncbi:hypothetical protein [Nocardia sp. NPDC052566]|uniref:hypothetical protein n=1 Tax=Nocardia sp. NPDC052566 TaxID=3364330 RepID=UPI0037CB0ED5